MIDDDGDDHEDDDDSYTAMPCYTAMLAMAV